MTFEYVVKEENDLPLTEAENRRTDNVMLNREAGVIRQRLRSPHLILHELEKG